MPNLFQYSFLNFNLFSIHIEVFIYLLLRWSALSWICSDANLLLRVISEIAPCFRGWMAIVRKQNQLLMGIPNWNSINFENFLPNYSTIFLPVFLNLCLSLFDYFSTFLSIFYRFFNRFLDILVIFFFQNFSGHWIEPCIC